MVEKMQAMWGTAVPCAPMPPAPGGLPAPAEVTWLTTLQCRASRTCSFSTAVLSQGPQLNPDLCLRPRYLGMPAFTRKPLCSAKVMHRSTCTVVCLETLISGLLTMSSRHVLYLDPGLSLTTSFSTYRPPVHTQVKALMPQHSPRLVQSNTYCIGKNVIDLTGVIVWVFCLDVLVSLRRIVMLQHANTF